MPTRERQAEVPGTLIVGYDGSPCAEAAFEEAIAIAKATGDRIVIGFGYEPPGYGEEMEPYREAVRRHGESVTAAAIEQAAAMGIDAELALVPESPSDALRSLAERYDARAIVVGSYGESPLRSAILGSTPHKLLHGAERPILVVPFREGG
jgi:nucleotide-binding universal stress UspA family protein